MAKEDFCFTYYDGDAARDMAHMNRLERGGYSDLMVSQRKFGHLSLNLIKKTLGNDFQITWEALEIILKKDAEGKYYIEWLQNSIIRDKNFSQAQSERGKKGGRPKKEIQLEKNPEETPEKPELKPGLKPLGKKSPEEDGGGDEDGFENEGLGKSENPLIRKLLIPEMLKAWKKHKPKYPTVEEKDFQALGQIASFIADQNEIPYNPRDGSVLDKILKDWDVMADFISKTDHVRDYNLEQVAKYRQTIIQKMQNGNSKTSLKNGSGLPGNAVIRPGKTFERTLRH